MARDIVSGWHPPDHTKVEAFRSRLSPETQRVLANETAKVAVVLGFADPSEVDFDSTLVSKGVTRMVLLEQMLPLVDLARQTSIDRLNRHAKVEDIHAVPIEPEAIAALPVSAQIIVAGDELEVVFRTHFELSTITTMTAHRLGSNTCTQELAADFIREFCNLVSGQIKSVLEAAGIAMAHGLPFVMKGHAETSSGRENPYQFVALWGLNSPLLGFIACSILVDVKKPSVVEKVVALSESVHLVPASGEIEIF